MYHEHFGFSEAPFQTTPDARFLFVNPGYEEAFATLRYGIDGRKGIIVVTGESGTGKTSLLKRLAHGLDPHVHTACIFDPHLSFAELLRCALIELGVAGPGEGRQALMAQLYDYLVRQFEGGQIVVLMIDEAQNLTEEMLEELRILSNLETDTEKLIQIVLVGQRDFEERLDQPQLRQLRQRVALRCRLRPLEKYEVGSYINSRLKTVQCKRQDLFDSESVARIALYSKGIPRLINIICDNAMLMAYANQASRVALEDIDQVARELELLDEPRSITGGGHFAHSAALRGDSFIDGRKRPAHAGFTGDSRPAQFEPPLVYFENRPAGRHGGQRARAYWVRVLLTFLITLNAGLIVGAQPREFYFSSVSQYLDRLTAFGREDERALATRARPKGQTLSDSDSVAKMKSTPDKVPPAGQGSSGEIAPEQEPPASSDAAIAVPTVKKEPRANESTEGAKKSPPVVRPSAPIRIADDGALARRKFEFAVYKAIHDRAIRSVGVAAFGGTVYLDGQVATLEQKIAAVSAAQSVPGVKDVHDRIMVVE